jgi:hypothetical protein
MCVLFVRYSASHGQIGALPVGVTDLHIATDSKYQVGDVWEYKTLAGEERSRFTVVKIDRSSNVGVIIHLAVDKLTWKTCRAI